MDVSVGDRVVLDAVEDRDGSSFSGPGVVLVVNSRGCMVETGPDDSWWVPRRFWGTRLRGADG